MLVKTKNGSSVAIPDNEIDRLVESLDISIVDAIDLYLEDHGMQENEEQEELDKKAKKEGFKLTNSSADTDKRKKGAPRTVNVSDEKKELFDSILSNLTRCVPVEAENITVLKENKLIEVKIGEKIFKIDVIESRNKKK